MRIAVALLVILIFTVSLVCSACSAEPVFPPSVTPGPVSGDLTPYLTSTPSQTPTSLPTLTFSSTPLPSPTPLTHTVQQGEDMFGIALHYGITLDALRAANPEVDPGLLRIGAVLIIPIQGATPMASEGLQAPPEIDLPLSPVHCVQDTSAGAWCFLQVTNNTVSSAQGVSVMFSLLDSQGNVSVSQSIAAPLDLLPAQTALPLAIYFPPPLTLPLQAAARLLTAFPVPEDDTRFLELHIENFRQQQRMDGLAVDVSGDLVLDSQGDAALVWVLAVAYDQSGEIVGIRRWESSAALLSGQVVPFSLRIYSTAAVIDHLKLFPEAHRQ